jgi:hypothetical protein
VKLFKGEKLMELAIAVFAVHSGVISIVALLGALLIGSVLAYSGTGGGAMDQNLGTFGPYVDAELSATGLIGGGAILQTHGTVLLTDAGVGVYTLAAPLAGSPANGGNDGQKLIVIDQSGHAHTITTPANKVNGNKHIATSAGNVGDEIVFRAWNGIWLVNPTSTAFVLS